MSSQVSSPGDRGTTVPGGRTRAGADPRWSRASTLTLAVGVVATGCAGSSARAPASTGVVASGEAALTVRAFGVSLAGVRTNGPAVELSLGHDPALPNESVLLVSYSAPTADPAGRDVWCEADHHDWTGGRAISFRVKPAHAVKLSVSFFDRNQVVYTSWIDLEGGRWQPVRVVFATIRPNPYFQPPGAKLGSPIDVSAVTGLAFAPHDAGPGHLAVSSIVLTR